MQMSTACTVADQPLADDLSKPSTERTAFREVCIGVTTKRNYFEAQDFLEVLEATNPSIIALCDLSTDDREYSIVNYYLAFVDQGGSIHEYHPDAGTKPLLFLSDEQIGNSVILEDCRVLASPTSGHISYRFHNSMDDDWLRQRVHDTWLELVRALPEDAVKIEWSTRSGNWWFVNARTSEADYVLELEFRDAKRDRTIEGLQSRLPEFPFHDVSWAAQSHPKQD